MTYEQITKLLAKRDNELQEALNTINELEDKLLELEENEINFVFCETEREMLEIIAKGVKELNSFGRLDKDDMKKFDSYVKDFVLLRGKMPKSKDKLSEDSEKNTAELIELARG